MSISLLPTIHLPLDFLPSRLAAVVVFIGGVGCAPLPAQTASTETTPPSKELRTQIEQLKKNTMAKMVPFKGGTFEMGNWGHYGFESADTRPLHKVTLDGFLMMAYKVTYEEFDLFTDSVGEQRVNMDEFGRKYRAPRKPAGVSWYGAQAYCQWLDKLTGKPFDLPTEAQWEYAARSGGKRVLFATDNGKVEEGRNYPADDDPRIKPRLIAFDVGSFPPNPAGLYGMLDYNSREWVQDWYDPTYYQRSSARNPKGGVEKDSIDPTHPADGTRKVMRGLQGTSLDLGGYVFTRGFGLPQTMYPNKYNELTQKQEWERAPGYSSIPSTQFRCVINAAPRSPSR